MKFNFLVLTMALTLSCKEPDDSTVVPKTETEEHTVSVIPGLGAILRTPESQFENLKDYTFQPHYIFLEDAGQLRMHYLDEGPRDGKIILLMHGNPAWVYNFRKIISALTAQGYRVICPDLIGFGRSDKPAERTAHTYDNQVKWITEFVKQLDLKEINLHCQDWGGLIGLRVAVMNQERFEKIAISNTSLPDGTNVTQAFLSWRSSSQTVATYSFVMERATVVELDALEEQAYDAPFPSEIFKAAPRELPLKVPIAPSDAKALENAAHWQTYAQWDIPILTIFSEIDEISEGEQERIMAEWLGAQGQNHLILPGTSHFIREDKPIEMAALLSTFFQ